MANLNTPKNFVYILLGILLLSGLIRINYAYKEAVPTGDEGPWMRLAVSFPEKNFMVSKVIEHDLYFQRSLPHPEDNRSPLFPILLSPARFFSNPYFAAKLLNLALILTLTFALCFLLKKYVGVATTLSFACLLGISPVVITYSSLVYPDILFALGVLLFVLTIPKFPSSIKSSFGSGLLIGLFFLLKSTAIFLLPGILIAFYLEKEEKQILIKFMAFSVTFMLCALPLMIYNIHHFNSPLYQFSGYNLWVDNGNQMFHVHEPRPSFSMYHQTHSFFFIFCERPVLGLMQLIKNFFKFDLYLSLWLLPLTLVGLYKLFKLLPVKNLRNYFLLFSLAYFPMMAYLSYSIWVTRYILVYYFIFYLLAALGMVCLTEKIAKPNFRLALNSVLLCIAFYSVAYPLEYYTSRRGSKVLQDHDIRALIHRIDKVVPTNAAVLSTEVGMYSFMHSMQSVNIFDEIENMQLLMDNYPIQYVLVPDVDKEKLSKTFIQKKGWKLISLDHEGSFTFYQLGH